MNYREIVDFKFNPALAECDQHQRRLHNAWLEAKEFSPLQEGSIEELNESQVRTLDQLLFRFGRLQDAIGTRLLPATLQMVQEWHDREPFLDKLNRAEKIAILSSVEQWQLLRELCNQTAHEYPDQPDLVRANLRLLVSQTPILEQIYTHIAAWGKAHIQNNLGE